MFSKTKINLFLDKIVEVISQKLKMNIKHPITFILSKLFDNNSIIENLLVFGSTNGNAYAGNSKALFEYLNEKTRYKCVWITKSDKIMKMLNNKNYNVISQKDWFKTIKTLKSAKYIFITHGFGDILMIDFSPKTKLIFLAHGISFKKGGDDMKESFFQRKIREKLNNDIDYFIDSSENNVKYKVSAYNIDPKKFIITGYPRNDYLINADKKLKEKIIQNLNLKGYNRILLYAPTFREYPYNDPFNHEFLVKLENFLRKNNDIFLYKPHPFIPKIDLSGYSNIIAIEPNVDITDLLIISDVLITDYSSVFIDFLFLNRPIIFFAHDLEKFKKVRDFYYDYENFVPGPIVKTGDELLELLNELEKFDKEYERKRVNVRKIFNKYNDGKAIERIMNFLNLN
ncbi:MAG: CDP-glycerol glycerophosphotransferase family protein [Promethearchaeota archaeon]